MAETRVKCDAGLCECPDCVARRPKKEVLFMSRNGVKRKLTLNPEVAVYNDRSTNPPQIYVVFPCPQTGNKFASRVVADLTGVIEKEEIK